MTFESAQKSKMVLARDEILLLFDVDGPLTLPRSTVEPELLSFLYDEIKPRATIGIVGGSDLEKMFEQLNGPSILNNFDYVFPVNGLVQIENGVELGRESIQKHLGEDVLQRFINYVLRYLSEVTLPVKRGTFVEFRDCMLNISPIGRSCTREERNAFNKYDNEHHVREKMIEALKKEFADTDLTYSIGGQISFDVVPRGWDKTFALRHVTKPGKNYKEIHFFGDKTEPGGNDYEIYIDPRTIGHKVDTPIDTRRILSEIFQLKK